MLWQDRATNYFCPNMHYSGVEICTCVTKHFLGIWLINFMFWYISTLDLRKLDLQLHIKHFLAYIKTNFAITQSKYLDFWKLDSHEIS